MTGTTKLLVGSLAAFGAIMLVKASRAAANLESFVTARIHSFDLSGLTLMVGIVLKNPTNGSLRIKYPYVTVAVNGGTIGSSDLKNEDVQIPANSQAVIKGLVLHFPTLSLTTVLPALYQLMSGAIPSIDFSVTVKTTAYAPGIPIPMPFASTETMKLGKPTAQ
jgi:hypothetical protein